MTEPKEVAPDTNRDHSKHRDNGTPSVSPGDLLGVGDAAMDRIIVVPEKNPANASDLLAALREAGEAGGVVLVGGWAAHGDITWDDLQDAVEPLLVFRVGESPSADTVLDAATESLGPWLAEKAETGVIGSENIAARLRRGHPITSVGGGHLFGPVAAPKKSKDRTAPDVPRARVFRATELKAAEQARWLAKNRIPQSAISLLVGDEGIGKSLAWVWIAAAVTTGKPLPEFGIPVRDPADVLLVITEDDWATTVLPRLEVAGADLDRVAVICTESDGSGAPVFPDDIDVVAQATPTPSLVVVDAWLDTVPAKLSVRDPQQARQALHPWREVAVSTGAAVLLLTHTNRVASANARDKYGATAELRKKARMALFAQRDDDGHLVIGPEKSNTAGQIPASRFVIDPVPHFPATEDHDGMVPRLRCIGQADKTSTEFIEDRFNGDTEGDGDVSGIQAWLRSYLLHHGATVVKDVKAAAKDEGFSPRSIDRAAKAIHVNRDSSGFPCVTTWSVGPVVTDLEAGE